MKNYPMTLVLGVWLVAFTSMFVYYSQERDCNKNEEPQLEDLVHAYLPKIPPQLHHGVTLAILAFLGLTLVQGSHSLRGVLSILLFRLGLFYTLRVIMNSVTELPCPERSCKNEGKTAIQKMLSLGGTRDCIPSGHTGSVLITLFTAVQLGLVSTPVAAVITLVQMLTPVLTRNHYSIDTIVSFFMSIVLCQNV